MNRSQARVVQFFIRPYRLVFGGIFLLIVVSAVIEAVTLVAFFPLFHALFGAMEVPPGMLGSLVSLINRLPVDDRLLAAAVVLIGLMCGKAVFNLLREILVASTAGTVLYDAKRRLMERYAASEYHFFLNEKQGHLMYAALWAPHKIASMLLRLPQVGAELLKVLAIVITLFWAWPLVTLVLVIFGGLYHAFTLYLSQRVSYFTGKGKTEASLAQSAVTNEFLTGIKQLITFRVRPMWLAKFDQPNRAYRKFFIQDVTWMATPIHVMEFCTVLFLVGLALLGRGQGGLAGQTNLPMLGVFAMAILRLLPSLTLAGRYRMEIRGTLSDAELVHAMLTAPLQPRPQGSWIFAGLRQAIVLDHVSYAYPGSGSPPALQDVSVTFPHGQMTAVVGSSGSGKTTLVNLLLGLCQPTQGRLLIDGISLEEYHWETWLAHIGFVSQEPFLTHATVLENILFGREGFTTQDAMRAAQFANAHDFIMALPDGYDAIVGERGMKLSGGQQQRIAIARAILADPDILIFDEATSHLDAEAEREVQEAMRQIAKDRTTIMVAHRPSTIRFADRIVVLEHGRIVEQGSHEELVSRQERYFQLVTSFGGSDG